MVRTAKRNVDYLTYYRAPAEASVPERLAARWALQLFAAHSARRHEIPPLDELLGAAGRLLVWSRPLLDAATAANGTERLAADVRLDRAQMAGSPLWSLAEGQADCAHAGFRTALKSARRRNCLVRDSLGWIARARAAETVGQRNVGWLAEGLGLSEADRTLLAVTILRYEWRGLVDLLTQIPIVNRQEGARLVADALEAPEHAVRASLGREGSLVRYGLLLPADVATDLGDVLQLNGYFVDALTRPHDCREALFAYLLQTSPPPELRLEDCAHLATEIEAARRLLANARGERGVNILLYGRPGTGKTQFARLIGQALGATVYETPFESHDGESVSTAARLRMLRFTERVVRAREDVLIVFDEAEDAFPVGGHYLAGFGASGPVQRQYSKAWMNHILESNRTPVVWITNLIGDMDPAFLRRFTLHIEFREPTRAVRAQMAARFLAPAGISAQTIARVAESDRLAPAQLETAARYLKLCAPAGADEAERLFEQQFRAARRAMGLGGLLHRPPQPLAYDARFANLEGELDVERLVAALGRRGAGSLCLWGPPGTGKTELAHHLARALDRELIVKTGGDLLGPFVGMTEGLIREMFERAAAQVDRCVLFLDEADTFLRDRGKAQYRWEASFTNEFLRQMENFPGIFVCATNLFAELDRAVLRRFQFRLEFRPLMVAQRTALFQQSFGLAPDGAASAALRALEGLVPADFANVVRQLELLELQATAGRALEMLATERRTRLAEGSDAKRIGFIR